jgi:1-acyl-sn-glycerol-3-phosphate acyltransferase
MSTVTLAAYMALRLWRIAAARKISRARWQSRVLRHWARATCTILGIRIESSGPHPGPPFLLVSNHLGYIDIAVLASQLDCVFVAKREVANWPIIGHLCRQVGTIFIDREHRSDVMRANAMIEQAIDQSRGVVLFPEGTSSRGSEVLRFRSSLLEIAARRDIPVNYAAIRYEAEDCDPPADQSVCWWGDMKFCSHF